MARSAAPSEVVTIRVPRELARRLRRRARQQRRPPSAVARMLLEAALADEVHDPDADARRQSLLVRDRQSEHDALSFITDVADLKGWQ